MSMEKMKEEMEKFAILFEVDVKVLEDVYAEILAIGEINDESLPEAGKDEVVIGRLDEFEKKAFFWAYRRQADKFTKDVVLTLVYMRIHLRLNSEGEIFFRSGFDIVVSKKDFLSHESRKAEWLACQAPANSFSLPL